MLSRLFAAESGPHISLKAEKIFEIGGFEVTNSMIYGLFVAVVMMAVGVYAAKRAKVAPVGGIVQFFEMTMEFIIKMLEDIFKSKDKAMKYAPIFGTFFVFIVFSNISGLMPIVGEGVAVGETPVFRPFTADLNATIAMSVIAIITVQVLSIKESGFLGHLKHYFTDKPFNPINMFIGVLEVFGEVTRVISLSLRLFLNTAVGEILIAVFIFVGGFAAPLTVLPIVLFEILVALIQAYVFTVLSATYLGLAIAHGHEEHAEDEHTDEVHDEADTTTGTIPASASASGK